MSSSAFVIRLHQPRGERWRELAGQPYVDATSEALSLPPAWVAIRLKEDVTAQDAEKIAEQFRARLDGGTVTVERSHVDS
jgi:hypothetical protein